MCVIVTERKKSACTFYGSKQSQINVFSVKAVVVKVALLREYGCWGALNV